MYVGRLVRASHFSFPNAIFREGRFLRPDYRALPSRKMSAETSYY